jgi:hypothetical protein
MPTTPFIRVSICQVYKLSHRPNSASPLGFASTAKAASNSEAVKLWPVARSH